MNGCATHSNFQISNRARTSSGVHPPLALRRVGPPIFLRNGTETNEIKYPPSVSAFGVRFPSSRVVVVIVVGRVHRHPAKRTRQGSFSSHSSRAPSGTSSSSSSSSPRLGGARVSHRFLPRVRGIFSRATSRVSPSSSSVSRVAPACASVSVAFESLQCATTTLALFGRVVCVC